MEAQMVVAMVSQQSLSPAGPKRNVRRAKRVITAFLALILHGTASAQPVDPRPARRSTENVTVRAQRVEDWNYSAKFVQSLLQPSFTMEGQFATWKVPVCPRVKGMSDGAAHLIEQRIRAIAKKIGAPLNLEGSCTPNIVIVATQEPQTILNGLKEKNTLLFAASSPGDLQMHYPVQVWYYSVDRDYNGQLWPDIPMDKYIGSSDTAGKATTPITSMPMMAGNNTNLYTGIQPEVRTAIIIADSNAIKGLALGSFADYVALLGLAQTPVTGRCQPAPSIANLFLTDCPEGIRTAGLSTADLAVLTGIYQTPDTPERLQKVRIINNMRKYLEMAQER